MRLDNYHRQRLAKLLLAIPGFDAVAARKVLLRGIFYHRPIWDGLKHEAAPDEAAHDLLDRCANDGESLCLLLTGLRAVPGLRPEQQQIVDDLAKRLCSGNARRRRQPWTHDAPFRGLNYFDREHAPIFFGRDAELRDLIRTLTTPQGSRFTVIVGASGAGKSSLVRAGLWASLANGEVPEFPDSRRWLITAMQPSDSRHGFFDALHNALNQAIGRQETSRRRLLDAFDTMPLADFATQLLDGTSMPRWLLLLDQMEELFAQEKKQEGAEFLDRLLEATAQPSPLQVVATLRADFFHHCLDHPPLRRAVFAVGGQFPLGPPDRMSLEHMVRGPIEELELPEPWLLDPSLPPTIAADAERRRGGLALMAFALRELWQHCADAGTRTMECDTYHSEQFGGLSGAIGRRADATLKSLGDKAEETLHRVFARLVRVSDDDDPVRQRESHSAWDADPEAQQLIEAFVDARLLVKDRGPDDQPVVDVAHEALLTEWPTLAAWIAERREDFRLASRVRAEARAWAGSHLDAQYRRPWPEDLIEDYRGRLTHAGLLQSLLTDPVVARLLTPESDWIIAELVQPQTTHRRRWEIGLRLDDIGDARPGVGVKNGIPDILWQPIPCGTVHIEGVGPKPVSEFQIATYPITVAQFRAFLDAEDGYRTKEWWKNLRKADPDRSWQNSSPANHPVTNVSWADATAFCRWLTAHSPHQIHLPTEAEWQWAAQSANPSFNYPWGPAWSGGPANTAEAGIGRTASVGMYPDGRSHQKVADLAGNVWEWCSGCEQKGGKEERRVSRGGSWSYDQRFARANSRNYYRPGARSFNVGFRVVCSSPIHGTLGR
ncbi:MAG: SUMF1/EgtB/PvdO family nonheme iron enzyme [Bryobacterales bacterium]|nr:SUMF1/EgtB/PvdO family nonheme iron enzyme [Bryobacterales bacterium]